MLKINRKNLKKARKSKNYTIEEVSEKIGVSYSTYYKWENGNNKPDLEKAKMLADLYETTVDVLFFSRVFRLI